MRRISAHLGHVRLCTLPSKMLLLLELLASLLFLRNCELYLGCRRCAFLGHVRLCTLPSGKPHPSRLACNYAVLSTLDLRRNTANKTLREWEMTIFFIHALTLSPQRYHYD